MESYLTYLEKIQTAKTEVELEIIWGEIDREYAYLAGTAVGRHDAGEAIEKIGKDLAERLNNISDSDSRGNERRLEGAEYNKIYKQYGSHEIDSAQAYAEEIASKIEKEYNTVLKPAYLKKKEEIKMQVMLEQSSMKSKHNKEMIDLQRKLQQAEEKRAKYEEKYGPLE